VLLSERNVRASHLRLRGIESRRARPEYAIAALALGREIARRGSGLVYGGASRGLIGVLADAALAEGGEVIGVIPHGLFQREVAHHGLTTLPRTIQLLFQ